MIKRITFLVALAAIFTLQLPQRVLAQEHTISGTVLSPDNTPLDGAAVVIKGTTTGTHTNQDGKFTISAAPGDVLVVSTVGFTTREITVGSSSTVTVTLEKGKRNYRK